MADDFNRFPPNGEEHVLDELRSLGVHDDAPPPNPRFVRALRGDLMERAATSSRQGPSAKSDATFTGSLSAALPTHPTNRRPFDRRLTLQLGLVAALLIAMIGSFVLMSGPDRGSNNILNGLATQSDTGDQPFALFHGDAARTGISPENGPVDVPSVIWRVQMTNPNLAPALAVDGVIYLVDDEGGQVQAVSATTGAPFWGASVGRMSGPSIAVANGFVYVVTSGGPSWGTDPGYLIALRRSDGREQWRYEFGGATASAPAVSDGQVYVVSTAGILHAVNATTGEPAWQLDFSGNAGDSLEASPAAGERFGVISPFSPVVSDGVIYVTAGEGALYAVSAESHEVMWTFQSDGNFLETAAVSGGQVFVPATLVPNPDTGSPDTGAPKDDGWIYALDAKTGAVNWTWNAGSRVSIVAVTVDQLFTQSNIGIVAMEPTSGELSSGVAQASVYNTIVTDDAIYVSVDGTIYAYDRHPTESGFSQLWASYMGVGYTAPVAVNDMIVSRGPNGTLIALGDRGASATSSPVANATPGFVDASGLPECSAPAPIEWQNVEGEPAHTIPPFDPDNNYDPAIGFDALPQGEPANASVTAGILLTIHALEQCARPGNMQDLSGFFSEDYFRRPVAKYNIELGRTPADIVSTGFGNAEGQTSLSDFTSLQVLPDGRVALFSSSRSDYGRLVIFVQNADGFWVIDETLSVSATPGAKG